MAIFNNDICFLLYVLLAQFYYYFFKSLRIALNLHIVVDVVLISFLLIITCIFYYSGICFACIINFKIGWVFDWNNFIRLSSKFFFLKPFTLVLFSSRFRSINNWMCNMYLICSSVVEQLVWWLLVCGMSSFATVMIGMAISHKTVGIACLCNVLYVLSLFYFFFLYRLLVLRYPLLPTWHCCCCYLCCLLSVVLLS